MILYSGTETTGGDGAVSFGAGKVGCVSFAPAKILNCTFGSGAGSFAAVTVGGAGVGAGVGAASEGYCSTFNWSRDVTPITGICGGGKRLHMHRRALATSRRSRYRHQVSRRQKEFAALRHDQSLAGELLLQSNRAARRHYAQRIVHIQARDDVAARSADVQRRRNHRRRENPQRRARRKLQVNAPEIQRQRDRIARLQQREFRRPANIHLAARHQRQSRLTVMHRHHAAVEDEARRPWRRCCRRAVRGRAVLAPKHHALRHARSRPAALLARAKPPHLPATATNASKQHSPIADAQTKDRDSAANCNREHIGTSASFRLYYTAVDTDAKSAAPQALQPRTRRSIRAARSSRAGAECKYPSSPGSCMERFA